MKNKITEQEKLQAVMQYEIDFYNMGKSKNSVYFPNSRHKAVDGDYEYEFYIRSVTKIAPNVYNVSYSHLRYEPDGQRTETISEHTHLYDFSDYSDVNGGTREIKASPNFSYSNKSENILVNSEPHPFN